MSQRVVYQWVSTHRGDTVSVTVSDQETDEVLGTIARELGPFEEVCEAFSDLRLAMPMQLPLSP